MIQNIVYRSHIKPSDLDAISGIVKSSGFFSEAETDLARELVEDKLTHGQESSYQFIFAEREQQVIGYTCFGLIPATSGSYDLYWIAVTEHSRGTGLGKDLMKRTENFIAALGGKRIYVETSSRDQYSPTHRFYETCHYLQEAILADFYMEGDSKIIYSKLL